MQNDLANVAGIIKSQLFLGALIVFALIIFGFFAFTTLTRPKPYLGIAWENEVTPGRTTTSQLEKELGKPSKTDGQTLYYPTTSKFRQTEIETSNNVVQVIKEPIVDRKKGVIPDYINSLGEPETLFYGEHEYAAPGYFWGSKGIMAFGNPKSGIILEIWYFPPTTKEQFEQEHPELKTEASQQDL